MTDPKRHHTVPKTYLEEFTNADGFLSVYSKFQTKTFPQKPKEATVQSYYYSQPVHQTGGRDHSLETKFFHEFEDAFPAFRSGLLNQPDRVSIEELTNQLLIQRVRSPAFREAFELALASYVNRHMNSIPRGEFPKPPANFPDIFDHLVVSVDPHRSITAMAHYIRTYGAILWELDYKVVPVKSGQTAITSDNPIIWFDKIGYKKSMEIYAENCSPTLRLFYPIDRKHYLVGRPKVGKLPTCQWGKSTMDTVLLGKVQRQQMLFAWDKVIGNHRIDRRTVAKSNSRSPTMRIAHYEHDSDRFVIDSQSVRTRDRKYKYETRSD